MLLNGTQSAGWILVVLALVCAGDTPPPEPNAHPEVVSPLGVKHYSKADANDEVGKAQQKLAGDPKNVDLLLALGRAQSAVWRYRDAIDTYSRAIAVAPNDARLYRHRGHRYISVRKFEQALTDLKRAAQLNDSDFDIWYHLGLAHYLRGEFEDARKAYEKCYAVAEKARVAIPADKDGRDDSLIAISDWLYMTHRRLNKPSESARILEKITSDMKVKENKSYYDRLLFYKGLKKEVELLSMKDAADLDIATVGYGLGNWHLYNGNRAKADEYFRRIVAGQYWPAFGFIAAEAELVQAKSK